jgi:hypothetical protein
MPATRDCYRIVERQGPARRLVLRCDGDRVSRMVVCSGFEGPELPDSLTDPRFDEGADGGWLLRCHEGSFEFRARALQQIEERPSLYGPLHRAFALSRADRLAVRVLLGLLRLPGGSRLLRLWHSRRG